MSRPSKANRAKLRKQSNKARYTGNKETEAPSMPASHRASAPAPEKRTRTATPHRSTRGQRGASTNAPTTESDAAPEKRRPASFSRRKKPLPDAPLIRLNKMIADSGLCSRREADRWIADGRITVNFETVTDLGTRATENDIVLVDDHPLPRHFKLTVAFHKPVGVVTTRKDEKGRKTIYDVLPKKYQGCDPAGRLDRQSSGLLILSNDGDLLQQLMHPSAGLDKVYRVRVDKPLTEDIPKKLKKGVNIFLEGPPPGAALADTAPDPNEPKPNATPTLAKAARAEIIAGDTLTIVLRTGLNRQIRRMLAALGYEVVMLRRLSVGPIELGRLPAGKTRALSKEELTELKRHWRRQQRYAAKAAGEAPPSHRKPHAKKGSAGAPKPEKRYKRPTLKD